MKERADDNPPVNAESRNYLSIYDALVSPFDLIHFTHNQLSTATGARNSSIAEHYR